MRNEKLNILHVHWAFPPTIGGVETHLSILLPELVKNGNNVSLITSSFPGQKNRTTFKGVELFRYPLFDLNRLAEQGLEGNEKPLQKIYSNHIDAFRPDIIHTHNMHYFSKPHIEVLEKICKEKGIPLVLTAHNVWNDHLFLELTRNINWAHIIAVSHYIRKELLAVGVEDSKATTIHHGIDVDQYKLQNIPKKNRRPFPELENKLVIFHPARACLGKGCDVVLKALPIVLEQFPGATLVMAGSSNIVDWDQSQATEISYFRSLIKTHQIQENVLVRFFPLEEMPYLYHLSDVVVYPSSVPEPFGLCLLEAFACSRPIIVTDSGGMPEIVQDKLSGLVIPMQNVDALAKGIVSLLESESLRKRLGDAGRKVAESQFAKEIMSKKHLALYRELLSCKAKGFSTNPVA